VCHGKPGVQLFRYLSFILSINQFVTNNSGHVYSTGGEDSLVSVVTRLLAGQSGVESQQGQELFFSQNPPDWLLGSSSLLISGPKCLCLGVKQPEHEVGHSLLSSAKVKNKWRYTSDPCLT
jgi:hypothetical protein